MTVPNIINYMKNVKRSPDYFLTFSCLLGSLFDLLCVLKERKTRWSHECRDNTYLTKRSKIRKGRAFIDRLDIGTGYC